MKTTHRFFRPLLIAALATAGAQAQEPAAPAAPATPPAAEPAAVAEPPAAAAPAPIPTADLTAAVEKLASAKNYAWSQTTSFAAMQPRTTTGKKGSGGFLLLNVPGRDQEMQVLVRKGKAVMKSDVGWVSAETAGGGGEGRGPARFIARMIQNSREPAVEAQELISKATGLKNENGKFSGTLNEETARALMAFGGGGRRGGGGGGAGGGTPPEITGAGGTVTFTVADGTLTGYEIALTGKMNFNGEERDVNRTTKVEFSGVGSTSFDIPEAAAGLLAE